MMETMSLGIAHVHSVWTWRRYLGRLPAPWGVSKAARVDAHPAHSRQS